MVWTVFLLEFLNGAKLREQITATTSKVEAYSGFAKWLNFGGKGVIDTMRPCGGYPRVMMCGQSVCIERELMRASGMIGCTSSTGLPDGRRPDSVFRQYRS